MKNGRTPREGTNKFQRFNLKSITLSFRHESNGAGMPASELPNVGSEMDLVIFGPVALTGLEVVTVMVLESLNGC